MAGMALVALTVALGLLLVGAVVVLQSVHRIGPTEVGLVIKRWGLRRLSDDNPIAFDGEAGYQAELLMPGTRFKLWPIYTVTRFPWVQVPAGEIGVVIAQIGAPLPIGAKSAHYYPEFGHFTDLRGFLDGGGEKGVQRPVLPPGTLVPIHPVAFIVITVREVFGLPVAPELAALERGGKLTPESFGLKPSQLRVLVIAPEGDRDMIGLVTALEGEPLPSGDIASRLGGFADIAAMEDNHTTDAEIMDVLLGSKNEQHNSYQDFQAFLDKGGRIGLQHDPLLYGAYLLNPFLVRVEMVPMLVVTQGQVAVIKGFVGLPTLDTSGDEFKFGSIVRPGHRGIWQEPLRTGKYAINPRIYAAELVPTFILTLNWAEVRSQAHNLDHRLEPIIGKSREGFVFTIDLQVQIHVSDSRAPRVISMVGTMLNLVNEVLQSAVGNYFRNTLQNLEAIRFIETREEVQQAAFQAITRYLAGYEVETRGVYIQDVIFPADLVEVLTHREIANQQRKTYEEQQRAETVRIEMDIGKHGLGLRGAKLEWFNGPEPIWHSMWEPMWIEAEESEVALSFHIGVGHGTTTCGPISVEQKLKGDLPRVSQATHQAVVAMQADECLVAILLCGALERHPGLKVVMAESHIGWIPYVLDRLDMKYKEGMYSDLISTKPSELFKSQVWATFQDDKVGARLAKDYGPDSFCWASDYPHADGIFPDSQSFIRDTMGDLDDDLQRKLTFLNAVRLYDLNWLL